MLRIRGKPVGDAAAGELARWLRVLDLETGMADRIDRAIDAGGGLIAANTVEARAILAAIARIAEHDPPAAERLDELTADLERHLTDDHAR